MKYLILGAGPAGLAFANRLEVNGEKSFLVLEHEAEAGGLCRSVDVDGSPLDIGGGHFLDIRRSHVNEFLFNFMPETEWNIYERDSRIDINGTLINHPIEANIWQLSIADQVKYLKSIAIAGCNLGNSMPESFVDWIYWKLGTQIAENYMIPYNQKMFGQDLNKLGTYWLEKLPNVSFEETLLSCLNKKAYGTQPGHAKFYYPKKYGYGELWKRLADNISNKIEYETTVEKIDFEKKVVVTQTGKEYSADIIVTTIPWMEFLDINGMPQELIDGIKQLKYTSIQTEYFEENLDTEAQWVYYPAPELAYHRILVRHNFCPNSHGYWTETNTSRISDMTITSSYRHVNKYAYPLNTVNKPIIMKNLLNWSSKRRVYGLGRWGEHQHYNSDLTVELAIKLADRLSL